MFETLFVRAYQQFMAIEQPMREWAAMLLLLWLIMNVTASYLDTLDWFDGL